MKINYRNLCFKIFLIFILGSISKVTLSQNIISEKKIFQKEILSETRNVSTENLRAVSTPKAIQSEGILFGNVTKPESYIRGNQTAFQGDVNLWRNIELEITPRIEKEVTVSQQQSTISTRENKQPASNTKGEAPVFYEVFVKNTQDLDGDTYYENWDFEIDIDALFSGVADNVFIEISDNYGHLWGPFGPYNFTGATNADNLTVTDFNTEFWNFVNPAQVYFTFYAYNANGNDSE